jgi:tetratricopeptide (TPR) repeat protein
MIGAMNFRSFLLVSTGAVLLAAGAAVAGAKDTSKPPEIELVEAAYRQLTDGRSADAIASYTRAIESQKLPSELVANALLNRALANQNLGRHDKAIEDYSAAMGSQTMPPPLRAVVFYNRGLSQQKLERLALAIEDFTSALLLDPELAQAYLSRASVLRQSGQYLFALGDYEKALRYSHAEPHLVLYGQALTYEALSRPLLAQNALARAIKVSPDFQPARDKLLALAGPEAVDLAADGGTAMLDETQQASLARQREELLTASLSVARPDVTAIPTELPAAVEPPEALVERVVDKPEARGAEALPATDDPRIEPTGEISQAATLKVAALVQPEPEPEPVLTELEGWMVQLSSQRDEDAAWTAWDQLSKRHGELLGGRDAAVVRAELDGKGVFYRLRVHRLASRSEAERLCSRLKARGTACYFGRAEG